jgi:hypothetical protein
MAFEGEHKIIPVKGIARAGADTLCEDGAMNEVIGLEYKDGSYVPYKEGARQHLLPLDAKEEASFFRVHKTSSGNNIIAGFKDYHGVKGLHWISEDRFNRGSGTVGENWNIIYGGDVKDVEFVGNVICISTDNGVLNYIFQDSHYIIWQIDKSKLPNISFRVDLGLVGKKVPDMPQAKDAVGVICSAFEKYSIDTAISLITKANGKVKEYGGLTGFFLVCAAYRLKTGEYIKASNPLLMCRPMHKFGNKFYNVKTGGSDFASDDGSLFEPNIGDKHTIVYTEQSWEDLDYIPKYEGNSGVVGTINSLMIGDTSGNRIFSTTDVFYPPMSCCAQVRLENENMSFYRATVLSNKLQYKIDKNIGVNEQLIDSLCIFISQEIDPFLDITDNDIEKNYLFSSVFLDKHDFRMTSAILKPHDEITKELKKINNLYLVSEIEYDDIKKSDNWIDVELEGKLGESLTIRDSLPLSAFDCSVFSSASLASYNSRLHMYNYTQSSEIYLNIEDFNLQGGFGQFSAELFKEYDYAYVIVDIENSNGKNRIVKRYNKPILSNMGEGMITMNPYIAFTHPNAKKISMICTINSLNFFMSFDLKKSKLGGYSYFINNELMANEAKETVGDISSITTPYNIDIQINTMRISETYNVNSFPYANTYVIGKGDIIGIASLSIALSQDTFGSYPLLVFTTEGIYSLETNKTGSSAYTNIPPPFSREVCINKNTICEIDGAVLFASSKGLMIASAQGVQEFLPTLNGTPRHLPAVDKDTNGLGLKLYRDAINNPLSTELLSSISHDDFIQFLSNADTVVSYVSNKNKVIAYNKNHEYSYWIDIPTRIVTKLPIGIAFDNDNYPTEQYVLNTGEVFEFGYLSNTYFDVQCLLQSRPIKNTYGMKSNLRVIARGYFNSSDADNYAVMLVLGSYDAINWQPIGICQRPFAGGFNDLGCVTDRVSCKYVMVIITGKMSADSHIDGIEMTINNKYNNKLK